MFAPYQIAQQQAQQPDQQQQSRDWWRGQRAPTPQQQMEMEAFRQALAAQYAPSPMQPSPQPAMIEAVQYQPLSYAQNIAPFLSMLRPSKMSAEQEAAAYGKFGKPTMTQNPTHRDMLKLLRTLRVITR